MFSEALNTFIQFISIFVNWLFSLTLTAGLTIGSLFLYAYVVKLFMSSFLDWLGGLHVSGPSHSGGKRKVKADSKTDTNNGAAKKDSK